MSRYGYCSGCKELSTVIRIGKNYRVEYCINKGCGHKKVFALPKKERANEYDNKISAGTTRKVS